MLTYEGCTMLTAFIESQTNKEMHAATVWKVIVANILHQALLFIQKNGWLESHTVLA